MESKPVYINGKQVSPIVQIDSIQDKNGKSFEEYLDARILAVVKNFLKTSTEFQTDQELLTQIKNNLKLTVDDIEDLDTYTESMQNNTTVLGDLTDRVTTLESADLSSEIDNLNTQLSDLSKSVESTIQEQVANQIASVTENLTTEVANSLGFDSETPNVRAIFEKVPNGIEATVRRNLGFKVPGENNERPSNILEITNSMHLAINNIREAALTLSKPTKSDIRLAAFGEDEDWSYFKQQIDNQIPTPAAVAYIAGKVKTENTTPESYRGTKWKIADLILSSKPPQDDDSELNYFTRLEGDENHETPDTGNHDENIRPEN